MISFIAAMDRKGVIGKKNQLPWHLPEDMRYFKKTTMGRPVVMGRKTFEAIGKPLPGRKNIVLTKNARFHPPGCTVFRRLDEFLDYAAGAKEEIFVIGGAEIFRQLLPYAERLYITRIHHDFEGDAFFPETDWREWKLASRTKGIKDEKNPYDYEFLVYVKKDPGSLSDGREE
jgi:dihydrofolate reductase